MNPSGAGAIALRDMRLDDIEGGLRLCRLAGWNQGPADWQALLAQGRIRVAVRDGRVIGSGGAVHYGKRLAWLAMILVEPDERGHGLATRLVADALEHLAGFFVVGLDATPEGVHVYSRHGFTDRGGLVRMERPAGASAPAAGAGAVALRESDLAEVGERDRAVFGADRAPLLRWALQQAPEYAWRLDGAGAPPSYVFGRHGHRTEHIGPLVAADDAAAASLVSAALAPVAGRACSIDVPDRPGWIERLEALGFGVRRPFRRMLLGSGGELGQPDALFAVTGPEFG